LVLLSVYNDIIIIIIIIAVIEFKTMPHEPRPRLNVLMQYLNANSIMLKVRVNKRNINLSQVDRQSPTYWVGASRAKAPPKLLKYHIKRVAYYYIHLQ